MLPRRSEQDHRSGVASLSSLGPSPGFASIAGIPVPFPGPSDTDRLLARAKDRSTGVAAMDGIPMGTAAAPGGPRPAPAPLSPPTRSHGRTPQPGPGTGRAPDTAEPVSGAASASSRTPGRLCPGVVSGSGGNFPEAAFTGRALPQGTGGCGSGSGRCPHQRALPAAAGAGGRCSLRSEHPKPRPSARPQHRWVPKGN